MKPNNIQGLLHFSQFLYQFRDIERTIYTHDGARRENDSEHSFQLALVAWYIASNTTLSYNIEKILLYALVHDLVEIYAGDTSSFAPEIQINSQPIREINALQHIKSQFDYFPLLGQYISDYENKVDAESKLVYFVDKLIPAINIYNSNGYEWKTEGLTLQDEQAYMQRKMQGIEIPSEIYQYRETIQQLIIQNYDTLFI